MISAGVRGVGKVACLHSAPLRCDPALVDTLRAHDVVIGDLNTTWRHLAVHVGATHANASMPSYLPPSLYARADMPPDFDHVMVRSGALRLAMRQVKCLRSGTDHRSVIHRDGWCSDHVPVEAVWEKAGARTRRLATWNVADPWYYARHAALQDARLASNVVKGFSVLREPARLADVHRVVIGLLERNAIVALQEVPSKIASALEEEARRRGIHVEESTDRSTHDPGDEADAPRVMLFVDRAELEDE